MTKNDNKQTSNDNQCENLIPMEMTREEYNRLAGAKAYPFVKLTIGTRVTHGILVPVPENVYRDYIRDLWSEEKKTERQRRCTVISEKTGKPVRCTKKCENCDRLKDGAPLSLDSFFDEDGYEVATNPAESSSVLEEMLLQDCLELLREKDPVLADVFDELCEGVSTRKIADNLFEGNHWTARTSVDKVRQILGEFVKREDLI